MYSIASAQRHEKIIKRSRFIGVICPCTGESQAARQLGTLHQEFPDASHLVFAYRVLMSPGSQRIRYRFHDAGEPSGTAGKPVYRHLEGRDLINVLTVVVRYFGGIKLGTGGLARAYSSTAKNVIEASTLVPYVEYQTVLLELDYNQLQALKYHLGKFNGEIVAQEFSEKVKVTVHLPCEHRSALETLIVGS